jgi:two-component system heavy metal sensor histidine kinase CusS
MSSKKDDLVASRARERRESARWSITKRLALVYTLSAFAMTAAVCALQYSILIRGLERDEVQLVVDKVRELEATLRLHGDDPRLLDHEVNLEGGVHEPGQLYVFYSRILDSTGRVVIETPGMSRLVPVAAFPPPGKAGASADIAPAQPVQLPNGQSYFLAAAWLRSSSGNEPRRVIQVALDDRGERAMVAAYRRDSLLVLGLATLLFASIGTAIARRGMRPVHDMARAAERITAGHSKAAFDPDPARWPEELTSLAAAFSRMVVRWMNHTAGVSNARKIWRTSCAPLSRT